MCYFLKEKHFCKISVFIALSLRISSGHQNIHPSMILWVIEVDIKQFWIIFLFCDGLYWLTINFWAFTWEPLKLGGQELSKMVRQKMRSWETHLWTIYFTTIQEQLKMFQNSEFIFHLNQLLDNVSVVKS